MPSDAEPGGERAPGALPSLLPDGCGMGAQRAPAAVFFSQFPAQSPWLEGVPRASSTAAEGEKRIGEQGTAALSPEPCVTLADAPPERSSAVPPPHRSCPGEARPRLCPAAPSSSHLLIPRISERSHFPFMLQSKKGFHLFFCCFSFLSLPPTSPLSL